LISKLRPANTFFPSILTSKFPIFNTPYSTTSTTSVVCLNLLK